ncbi:MAG TPA: HAD family hydrolase [Nitrososphaerales archaeon]|nr:HAD family hydrolase [Nitrososphaerales archaeon]
MEIDAVLFDYGGTLVNEKETWDSVRPKATRAVYNYLVRSDLDVSSPRFEEINSLVFQKYRDLEVAEMKDFPDLVKYEEVIEEIYGDRPKGLKQTLAKGATDEFWRVAMKNFTPRPDVKQSLSALDSMGLKMAVVSNHHNREALVGHLEELGIASHFDPIIASCEVAIRKPDPRIFRYCLNRLKVKPRRAIFVGDLLAYDIAGAKSVGMHAVLVPDSTTKAHNEGVSVKPEFVIKSLSDLPQIVSRIQGLPG